MPNEIYLDAVDATGDVLGTVCVEVKLDDDGRLVGTSLPRITADRDFTIDHIVIRAVSGRKMAQTEPVNYGQAVRAGEVATLHFDEYIARISPRLTHAE